MAEHNLEFAQANNPATSSHDALINKMAQDNLLGGQGISTAPEKAPESAMARYGVVTISGLENVPKGMINAVSEDLKHPLQTLETFGTAAGVAVALKTILPEAGSAGKIASAAIGAYFTYEAAKPIAEGYKKAGSATTMNELDAAATQIGDAGGSFLVNSAIAAVGYKVGSNVSERVLTSQSFDGFADAKANFYDKLGQTGTKMTDAIGITTPSEPKFGNNTASDRIKFSGSEKAAPVGTLKGEVDPNAEMQVSVMLKSKATDLRVDRTLARIAEGRQAPLNDADMAKTFGSTQESLDAVAKFAQQSGLSVSEANLTSGRIVLKGTTVQFTDAFDTKLSQYEHPSGVTYRGREGALTIPKALNDHIISILGMDDRPQARSFAVKLNAISDHGTPGTPSDPARPHFGGGFMPTDVAKAYNFPTDSMGKGQAVAIIELGGGIDKADNAQYYTDHNLPQPNINVIEVSGAKNAPGGDADGEVLLDSQVIGAIAPEATQNLIFAPNSDQGFVDAITRGAFPEQGEVPNTAISISWGQNEESWTPQATDGMNAAFKKAALKGISIFAASGDDGARDNAPSGTKQADYPSSDPFVTGTGGTALETGNDGKITSEVAWSNGGGGVSQKFGPVDFQADAKVPNNVNTGKPGRGVPDISGNAAPETGYLIRVDGSEQVIGGTSAVSPLYSALMMRVNGALGKPVPNLNSWLYKNTNIFNDITSGDNGGYSAGPGYDAVTGLGSIDGTKMLSALKSNPSVARSFGNFQYVGPSFVGPTNFTASEQQK